MAITGISSIDNKQIIAAGALSAISANQALVTSGGDSLQGLYDTVSTNSGSWTGGGGASYTSPNSTIWISADKIESTDSAYIPSHQEDVLLTATTTWSSINGYNNLDNTNKVLFRVQTNRASAFDNEGTFLNSANNTTAWAETEYPPIKLYTNTWASVQYSAYSAGITDAYVVELARKNEVNSALNTKLDSSAFTGYYPSNNPSGFCKTTDVVMQSGVNLFDGRVVGINNQYLMGCDSACNYTLVGTSAATGTKTASAYVGTGHQGINIQISARNASFSNYINWTAFSENGSNLSAGQLAFNSVTNKISGFEFNSPLAENISGVKLYGNNQNFTAYSAYTIDVKPLASQNNITFLSGAIDYVSANAGGSVPDEVMSAASAVSANSANWNEISAYQQASGAYLLEVATSAGIVGDGSTQNPLRADETVLFSGDLTASSTAQLTESWKNFEEIRCYGYSGPGGAMFGCGRTNDLLSAYVDNIWCPDIGLNTVASWVHRDNFSINANLPLVFSADNSVASLNGRLLGYWNGQWQLSTNEQRCHCTLILGINRKAQ